MVQSDFQQGAASFAAERFYPAHRDRDGGSEACKSGQACVFAPRDVEGGRVLPVGAKVSDAPMIVLVFLNQ